MAIRVSKETALGRRLRRHALDPPDARSVAEVADRVVAFRAWPAEAAALMVATRLSIPSMSALDDALARGLVIRSYAFRGGAYVFTRAAAAELLTARLATGIWQTKRWQQQGALDIDDWEPLRAAVRGALSTGPKTRGEISEFLHREPRLRTLAASAHGLGADSLYKPLHWWGDICFGPSHEGEATFQLLDPGLEPLDLDDAGRAAVRTYLHSYAPATDANLAYWLTDGLGVPRKRLRGWIDDLGDEIVTVDIEGEPAFALASDLDGILDSPPSTGVRLLPAFDPWVFGPGTADARVTPPQLRALASTGSNLVVAGGVVTGTWKIRRGVLDLALVSPVDALQLEAEVKRLSAIRGLELQVTGATPP